MKVSRQKALSDWERELLRGAAKDPGPPPIELQKMYKDNPQNEWLIQAVARLGGHKNIAKLIKRSPTYIYNIMKGYYPMSKELETLITKELEKAK